MILFGSTNKVMEECQTTPNSIYNESPLFYSKPVGISTTMAEEPGAAAYTHGTQIYLSEDLMDMCIKHKLYAADLQNLLAHEVFHCLTRCNPDFRADMYELIHFTVQDGEYELPASVLEYYISNPDVEHHNAYATFDIGGTPTDCYAVAKIVHGRFCLCQLFPLHVPVCRAGRLQRQHPVRDGIRNRP